MSHPSANIGPSDLRSQLADGPFDEGAYVRIYCPYHGDTTNPSGAVYEGHFYCFTCSRWAGRKEFLQLLSQTSGITAVSVVGKGTGNGSPVSHALAEGYAKLLWGPRRERLSWLLERGLDEDTIRRANLGHTGSKFSIPIYSCGSPVQGSGLSEDEASHRSNDEESDSERKLVGIKYRLDPYYDTCPDECRCPKYTNSVGSTASLYRPVAQIIGGIWALCEGEFDALLLTRYGIRACSLTSGAASGDAALSPLDDAEEVVICYDADRIGQRGALRVRDRIGSRARIATWHVERDEEGHVKPGWPKDVTDYVKMYGIEKFRKVANL